MKNRRTISIILLLALLLTLPGCAPKQEAAPSPVPATPEPAAITPAPQPTADGTPAPVVQYTPAPNFEPEYPLFSDDYYAVMPIEGTQYAVYNCMGELVAEFSQTVNVDYEDSQVGFCGLYPKDALVGSFDLGRLTMSNRTPSNSYNYSHGIACIDHENMKIYAYDEQGNERYSVDMEFKDIPTDYGHAYFMMGGILGFGENDIVFISSRPVLDQNYDNVLPISPTIYSKDGKLIKTVSEDTLGGMLCGTFGEYLVIRPDDPDYLAFRLVDINGKTIRENISAATRNSFYCDSELPSHIFEANYIFDSEGVLYDTKLKRVDKSPLYAFRSWNEDDDWGYEGHLLDAVRLLMGTTPDGRILGSDLYTSQGITCTQYVYPRDSSWVDGMTVYGLNEEQDRMLIHTEQSDYILTPDSPGWDLSGINNSFAFVSWYNEEDGREESRIISLKLGVSPDDIYFRFAQLGKDIVVVEPETQEEKYFVYNADCELVLKSNAEAIIPTYDNKLVIKRGAYTGIADMYGNWLLRGPSVTLLNEYEPVEQP